MGRQKGTVGIYGGIGDYIHYSWANYMRYGTYRSSSSSGSIYDGINEGKARLKSMLTDISVAGNVQEIANYYTDFLFGLDNNSLSNIVHNVKNNIPVSQYQQELYNYIQSNLKLNYSITESLSATPTLGGMNGIVTEWRRGENQKWVYISTIEKRITELGQLVSNWGKMDESQIKEMSPSLLAAVQNSVAQAQSISNEFNQILTNLSADISANGTSSMGRITGGYTKGKVYLTEMDLSGKLNGTYTKFGNRVSELLNQASRLVQVISEKTILSQVGIVGEAAVAAASTVAGSVYQKASNEIIGALKSGKYLTGKNVSTTDLNISTIVDIKNLLTDKNSSFTSTKVYDNQEVSASEKGDYFGIKKSQDTVDVEIGFETDNNIFKTTNFTASVKNYSSFNNDKGIKAISSTSLLAILNLIGDRFANHYLNLAVQHVDSCINQSIPESAQDLMKYAMAVRALSGAKSEGFGKLSKYFIAINRAEKRVYVGTTESILSSIEQNPNYMDVQGLPISGGSIANNWCTTVNQRITSVIAAAQAWKLSGSLPQSTLYSVLTPGNISV